jgi:excisionase family DNA binding protein
MVSPMLQLPSRTLLTCKDVSVALDVHVNTVRRMIASGQLQAVRVGKSVRVTREALADALKPWQAA